MADRTADIAFVGFGEAGMAFAAGLAATAAGFDRKTDDPATAQRKRANFATLGVRGAAGNAAAVSGASLIVSLVTADQALAAAAETAASIAPGALYCDMNSVAPETKRAARDAIEARGGRYVDVAVMAPVHPAGRAVPLLVSGPHAAAAVAELERFGFAPRAIDGPVGAASAIKMIRSVMVKGLEALTGECLLAAEAAGVADEVFASFKRDWPGTDWLAKADYNLGRMMMHGLRRAAEMEEVVKTLDGLGTGSAMARATTERQRAIGALRLAPPAPLADKLALLLAPKARAA